MLPPRPRHLRPLIRVSENIDQSDEINIGRNSGSGVPVIVNVDVGVCISVLPCFNVRFYLHRSSSPITFANVNSWRYLLVLDISDPLSGYQRISTKVMKLTLAATAVAVFLLVLALTLAFVFVFCP